jgi:hypothetical protein
VKPHHEHEFEAAPGLPEALPAGEHILWQGSPDWKLLAVDAFHVKRLSIYFSLMIALQAVMIWDTSLGLLANLSALSIGAILATVSLSLLALTAWLSASTTTAQIRDQGNGFGEIALELKGDDRIAYLHLWPHARAWHIGQPQPALRCIANAKEVGTLLYEAWEKRMAEVAATPDPHDARIPVRMPDGVFAR